MLTDHEMALVLHVEHGAERFVELSKENPHYKNQTQPEHWESVKLVKIIRRLLAERIPTCI